MLDLSRLVLPGPRALLCTTPFDNNPNPLIDRQNRMRPDRVQT